MERIAPSDPDNGMFSEFDGHHDAEVGREVVEKPHTGRAREVSLQTPAHVDQLSGDCPDSARAYCEAKYSAGVGRYRLRGAYRQNVGRV